MNGIIALGIVIGAFIVAMAISPVLAALLVVGVFYIVSMYGQP